MRAAARVTAAVLAIVGTAGLAWIAVTLVWGEPYTAFQASRAQAALKLELAERETAWTARGHARTVRRRADAFRAELGRGDALGRISIPAIGLEAVVVEGTAAHDLARGPGHYPSTPLPGFGGTFAIAGHRTTFLHPFRHIDELGRGDRIELRMPYGSFRYVVDRRAIVDDHDWSVIRPQGFEQLVLTACHPLHSASRRIVVFARLRGVV